MNRKIIIVAYNIHTGGGKTLLLSLLNSIPKNEEIILYADHRLKNDLWGYETKIKFIKKNILSRFYAEINLRLTSKKNDITLMFGGLPPIFRNASSSYLFIQNINNISSTSLRGYSYHHFLRINLERIWLRFFYGNVQKIIVQTKFVKDILIKNGLYKDDIYILPFFDMNNFCSKLNIKRINIGVKPDSFSFIYPASYEPHKNHIILISAWQMLANIKIIPTLYLTLKESDFKKLMNKFSYSNNINIINLGVLKRNLLLDFCSRSDCMIYPSKYESFGLPLIEASRLNLPIIAPELQYVREVCCPVETFDPSSPTSLADSVKRFMGIKTSTLNILDPGDFFNYLLNDS